MAFSMFRFLVFILCLCLVLPIVALPHSYDNSQRDVPYFTGVSPPVPNPDFLRGVNIGGWLVLEKWMNPDVFTSPFASAIDQWTFDSTPGAAEALQAHWSTYFTEADVWTIKSYGFNSLRIPIGYWAFDNANTPYLLGASTHLDNAITWCRAAGLKILLDCHGSPGSQNGFDNSGHAGPIHWQEPANLALSISVLETIAAKYGSRDYADVIAAIEVVNEPTASDIDATRQFANDAYAAAKAAASNPALIVVMHDAFQPLSSWSSPPTVRNDAFAFALDTHPYQLFPPTPPSLDQNQHISRACAFSSLTNPATPPIYIGEFSALSNICVAPDGTTMPGTSCDVQGCQCQSAPLEKWGDALIAQTRRFFEAQIEVFEGAQGAGGTGVKGWFLWSWHGPDGWGVKNLVEMGVVPQPLGEKRFGRQCF